MFYESHQSQWVLGQRPVSDLLSEPQGKLSAALRGEQPVKPEVVKNLLDRIDTIDEPLRDVIPGPDTPATPVTGRSAEQVGTDRS